jgi:hypothetical protein
MTLLSVALCGCQGLKSDPATVTPPPPSGSLTSVKHVVFMLQENRSFDTYFGMLNPYRQSKGWNVGDDGNTYNVDGIDDKLTKFVNYDDEGDAFSLFKFQSVCVDDMSSAWLESYGDVNRYDFLASRPILMDGFVHTALPFMLIETWNDYEEGTAVERGTATACGNS